MALYGSIEEGVAAGIPTDRLMRVSDWTAEGEANVHYFDMGEDLQARLKADQEVYRQMEEAGTPFWCVHKDDGKDRSVSHQAAYWQEDNESKPPFSKHGVRCRDCGGYIQLG